MASRADAIRTLYHFFVRLREKAVRHRKRNGISVPQIRIPM